MYRCNIKPEWINECRNNSGLPDSPLWAPPWRGRGTSTSRQPPQYQSRNGINKLQSIKNKWYIHFFIREDEKNSKKSGEWMSSESHKAFAYLALLPKKSHSYLIICIPKTEKWCLKSCWNNHIPCLIWYLLIAFAVETAETLAHHVPFNTRRDIIYIPKIKYPLWYAMMQVLKNLLINYF